MRSTLQTQAARFGPSEAERMLRAILQTMESIEQNVNVRVALEVLMLDVPTLKA
jgi:DNA polymerase-3 subunit delta'